MMKRSAWSRLWALVLTCMMLISMVPAEALGEGGVAGTGFFTFKATNVATNVPSTDNLNDFVTEEKLHLSDMEDGKYVMYPGTDYTLSLTFTEKGDELQFASDTRVFTYTLPEGICPSPLMEEGRTSFGPIKITEDDGTEKEYTVYFTYHIDTSTNSIKIEFNSDEATQKYLTVVNNGKISVEARVRYDESKHKDEIVFNDGTKYSVKQVPTNVEVAKRNEGYVATNGNEYVIQYYVDVTSYGHNENVIISDAIKAQTPNTLGATFKYETVSVKKNGGWENLFDAASLTKAIDHFQYNLGTMEDGETYQIAYQVAIPRNETTMGLENVEIGNGVKVSWKENQMGNTDDNSFKIDKLPSADVINKWGTANDASIVKIGEKNYQIIDWTINVNADNAVTLTNKTLTDTLGENMQFYGKGIHDGDTLIPWENVDVNNNSFTYTFNDTEPLAHEITYQTIVCVDDFAGQKDFVNTADYDNGSETEGSHVYVKGELVQIDKEFAGMNYDDDTMTWTIRLTVPESAKDVVVTDTYPKSSYWTNDFEVKMADPVTKCTVEGLTEDETWSGTTVTNESGVGQYQIKLSLNGSDAENANETKRDIVFTIVTKLDPAWKEHDALESWKSTFSRTNNVSAVVDSQWETSDAATGSYTIIRLNKYTDGVKDKPKFTVDGLPIFSYKIEIKDVQMDHGTFTDIFDTNLLELYGDVVVTTNPWGGIESTVNATPTASGLTLDVDFVKDSTTGKYFDTYTIFYSLKVKSKTELDKLIELAKANGGKYTPSNTISGYGRTDNGNNGSFLPSFEYKPISKSVSEGPTVKNGYVVTYKVVINETGMRMNNGQPIQVTDVMSNLRLVEGTVEVRENGTSVPPSYITEGNTIVFTVNDSTRVEITYKARVIFSDAEKMEDGNLKVPVSNMASISVYGRTESDTEEKTYEASSDAFFEGSQNRIRIKKVSALNSASTISGVTFDLYQRNDLTGKVTKIYTGTTGEDGILTVAATENMHLWAYDDYTATKYSYYFIETDAPEGYVVDSTPIEFKLWTHPTNITGSSDYPNYDGMITVVNYPTDAALPKIVKVDAGTEKPLSGAEFVLTNEAGETVATWVSGEAAHYFRKGLADGDYTLKETSVPDGYTTEGDMCVHFTVKDNVFSSATSNSNAIGVQTSDDGLTLTVTNKEIAKTEITVSKKWENLGNQDVAYPDSITIRLCRQIAGQSGWTEVSVVTLSDENTGWTYTWSDLPETDSNGKLYSYQVFENEVPGYRPWVTDGETGKEITNTLITIGVKVTKKWVGDTEDERPDEITVQLFRDDDAENPYREATLRKGENIVTWEYLPKVNPTTKQDYVYTVKEQIPDAYKNDYSSEVTEEATSSDNVIAFLITNTKIEKTEFAVEKVWIGDEESQRPANIKVQLKQNGEKYGEPVTIAADAEGKWNYKWSDLPAKDANGKAYSYTVEEIEVNGYTAAYDSTTEEGKTTITNTLKTTSYEVEKKWVGDEESNRPASITVKLLQNNKEYKTAELTASGNWSYSWTNLPAEDAQGNAYTYTVDEVNVPTNYTKTVEIDGTKTTITNTRNTKTTSLSVEKVWVGGVGAESVKVQLKRNDEVYETVELNAENEWKHDWTDLVAGEVKDGAWVTYTYTVDEENVPTNYTKSVKTDGTKTTITNTRNTKTTSLSVEKVWVGGVGAESVKVQLYRNDVALGDPVELNAENEWKHDWTNLVAGEVKDGA